MHSNTDDSIPMHQMDRIAILHSPSNQKSFISQRAMAQYVGVNSMTWITGSLQSLAAGNTSITADARQLVRKTILHMQATKDIRLTYLPTYIRKMQLFLTRDASFANERGFKSQVSLVLWMSYEHHTFISIPYSSWRWRCATPPVMASVSELRPALYSSSDSTGL